MTEFIQGPMWTFASLFFVAGVIWRLAVILLCRSPRDLSSPRGSAGLGALKTILGRFAARRQVIQSSRFQVVAGYMFHLGLFALLVFAAPHIRFLNQQYGISWPAMPHWAFIVAAEFAFAGLILLWLRRVLHPVTRLLSGLDDHLASGLTLIAMFTGCLALFESYDQLRVLHLFTVELLLVYFPFSNLMHAFTFVFSRGATGAIAGRQGVTR